ncbi:MAG: TetR/AcrR family transcriptional regulator [Proteobacteria bacterium]|nr:TetR/AcrR family transcriptional regulator [Pseudomonadota bacterium]
MRNTRNEIIEAADVVFNEQGYVSPSIDKLSAAANVSKMTFYKYFSDKENLILAVLEKRKSDFISKINNIILEPSTPRNRLKKIFDFYSSWISSHDFNGCMFTRAATEYGATSSLVIQLNDKLKTEITTLIACLLKEALNPELAERCALTVMVLIDGAIAVSLCPSLVNDYKPIDLAWLSAKSLILNEYDDF